MLEAGWSTLKILLGIARSYITAVTTFYIMTVTNHTLSATLLYPLRTLVFRPLGADHIWSNIVSSLTTISLIYGVCASLRDRYNPSQTWQEYFWGCRGIAFLFVVLAAGSIASELAGIPWEGVSLGSAILAFMATMVSGCLMYGIVHKWRNVLEDLFLDALEMAADN